MEGPLFSYQPDFGSSKLEADQVRLITEELPSPKQDDTDVLNAKATFRYRQILKYNIINQYWNINVHEQSFVATPPEPEPNPLDEEEAGQKFERGGASILYVHTFCAELLGETSSLELCR